VALKQKGKDAKPRKAATPKAGPKKKAAMSEAERIRAAIEKTTAKRGLPSNRTRRYRYKRRTAAKPERNIDFEQELQYGLREPRGLTPFEEFEAGLPDDQRPFARRLWMMSCTHGERVVATKESWTTGETDKLVVCDNCGYAGKWLGSRTATLRREWQTYCPDGFDAFEWDDLFVTDKSLWPFIYDEAEFAMVADSMRGED